MIECIFTLDYEIYGSGTGSLKDLVYEPAAQLASVFDRHRARFVVFVEAAEFERIEEFGTDPAIDLVKEQVRNLDRAGFEIGLHLHPWWSNARRDGANWVLDYSEYNLCTLPAARISSIVSEGIRYLRHLVGRPDFRPLSFRAGNWLFQPTEPVASILAKSGIRVDSSVFRGGRQHNHGLDYRRTPKGLYFWPFSSDVTTTDPRGSLVEIPIHTESVPFWRMQAAKRLAHGNAFGGAGRNPLALLTRTCDFVRLSHPLKLDLCRLTTAQMVSMIRRVLETDAETPDVYRPIVAIGHTKDLSGIDAVDSFLAFLSANQIAACTFADSLQRLNLPASHLALDRSPGALAPGLKPPEVKR
jgi:hypothetical protein